ncbi:MAG: hypothetical protein DI622_11420 [Chryseobacterium sp.]|uniref:RES family NAD+ phosphorylase n=1 Tax=Chryseobacterium sp. TaxID=1871047 RepID=UPI000DB8589F|nr:RES family NAD+ phosphorylase [Chryseobacterium sp.]MPS66821.1 RES domain-containing protein [Chryseobacterium sp.]PZU16617.1 MAG: hypothetical protein DI622_11420 [Chryseobacterium sp.]
MNKEDIFICIQCVKDIRYKKLLEQKGSEAKCSCCENNNLIIDTNSNDFIQLTKALIRYHYSEWIYNEEFGGDHYCSLLFSDESLFFNVDRFNPAVLDELSDRIYLFGGSYDSYQSGVSLFSGYYDTYKLPLLESIKTDLDSSILKIERQLLVENYFQYEAEISKLLSLYVNSCQMTIKKDSEFFRARIGYQHEERVHYNSKVETKTIYIPYSGDKIGAPPPNIVGTGRINRPGVSYLYCATDEYTAISEIRPHPGDVVSIGKFIVDKDLKIFDLSEVQFLNYFESDKKIKEFKILNTFTELLQKVIPPSKRDEYNITQLIADCIRKLDFAGILFPSSVGNGDNLVIFNPKDMSFDSKGSKAVIVNKISYEYSNN